VFDTDTLGVDWFILRCSGLVDLGVDSGHSTEPPGYLQLLLWKYLSAPRGPISIRYFEFAPFLTTAISSTQLCRLGELALVLELGHRSCLFSSRDIAALVQYRVDWGPVEMPLLDKEISSPLYPLINQPPKVAVSLPLHQTQ
jgi:hypothetical protein